MAVDRLAARAFDAMAEEYERGRPGWPIDAVAEVVSQFRARRVLDLAAGTGKLTAVLAAVADEVVAVEPLDGMRRVLASRLPAVHVVAGTAEAIPLPDAAVDAAFVAEAFHWFDLSRATAELARVVRPGGGLAVLWNHAQWEDQAWHDDVYALLEPHHLAVGGSRRANVPWREALEASRWFGPLADGTVDHSQRTDRDGIVAMLSSFSWIGGLPDGERKATVGAVRRVLERHRVEAVTLRYRTTIVTTRRVDG